MKARKYQIEKTLLIVFFLCLLILSGCSRVKGGVAIDPTAPPVHYEPRVPLDAEQEAHADTAEQEAGGPEAGEVSDDESADDAAGNPDDTSVQEVAAPGGLEVDEVALDGSDAIAVESEGDMETEDLSGQPAHEPDANHVYINKSSAPVRIMQGKVYHWVKEGGEFRSEPEVDEVAEPEVAEVEVAEVDAEEEAIDADVAGLTTIAIAGGMEVDEALDAEPSQVVEPASGEPASGEPASVDMESMPVEPVAAEPEFETSGLQDARPEAVPVFADEAPDPEALFNVREVVDLVRRYELAMRERDSMGLLGIFDTSAIFQLNMDTVGGRLSGTYTLDEFVEKHRKGWATNAGYEFSVADVFVTLSDDGTTAIAQGKAREVMITDRDRVMAFSDQRFSVEKVGRDLIITGIEVEGYMMSNPLY